jgi:hypothetical protein
MKSHTSETSTLAATTAPELQPNVTSNSGASSENSTTVEVGSEPSCSRRSIESIMLGRPHPYRADDQPEEGTATQNQTNEGVEDSSESFPQVLMDQALASAIIKLNQAKARRAVTPETTQNVKSPQKETEPPAGTNNRNNQNSVRSDSYSSSYYGSSNHDEEHDEDDDDDDFETNAEAWKMGTEMTFALDHLRACTECWSAFEQLSAARKEAEKGTGETEETLNPELSAEELEHAVSVGASSWKQHKRFIIEFREGAHHDVNTASTDGTTPNAECVFRIGLEHLKTCAGCPGHLVAPETAPSWTQELPPQEETCWICGRESPYPTLELPDSATWGGKGSSHELFEGSCYSCQETFGSSPPPAPYHSWADFNAGRISPNPDQCSSRGLEDNYDRCVSPTPSRWLASSPQYYPKGLEISYHGSDSSKSSRSLTYPPPRGLDVNIDHHLSPSPLRPRTFFSSRQATFGSSPSPAQGSENGSTHAPRRSSSSSIEHKCICFKCGREPIELSESPLVSGMRSPRSSTPALIAPSTFVPPLFHKSFSRQSLNSKTQQTTSPIPRNNPRAPPPSPATSVQAITGPSGYRRQFRRADNNTSGPAAPPAPEKKFKFTFPGKKVTGMPGRSPSPLDLNALREPKPRRAMPSVIEVLNSHPCLEGNFDSSLPLPEEDKRGQQVWVGL